MPLVNCLFLIRLLSSMAGKITSLSSENVLNQLDAVREAMLNFRYEQASKILELFICLIAINEEVAKYSSIIWAWLGECFFNSDKIKESVQPYQKALNICLAENDISGIWCYLKSLYDIYCYLEDYENAQRICEQIVEFFQKNKKDDPRLAQYQSEARILQKMTRFPLVRVVVQVGKQLFELDEISSLQKESLANATIRFNFVRNRITRHSSYHHLQLGRKLGSESKFADALKEFH
jgi:tetratricopeptide (TPR) repeat protein